MSFQLFTTKTISLEKIKELYGISKPTLVKLKKEHKKELDLTEGKHSKILDTPKNHKFFQNLSNQRQGKWAGKTKNIEVDWSPLVSHSKIFTIPMELYSELSQNKLIPLHVHHQIPEVMKILHDYDTDFFEEKNKKNRYSDLVIQAFNKAIGEIKDRKIEKINIADLNFQLGYIWPKLTKEIKNKIHRYIDIDISLVRLERIISKENPHPQLEKWEAKDRQKIILRDNNIAENTLLRTDLLRNLYQKQVFTKKNDTSTIHFISANHLYSRSQKDGQSFLSNVRRSMDNKDYMMLAFMIPSEIKNVKEKFDSEEMEKSITYTLRKILGLEKDKNFSLDKNEYTENSFKIYAKILNNINIHLGNLNNEYGKLEIDRNLFFKKDDKILLTQRYYLSRKEIEDILSDFGFESIYFDFDQVLEMGVFVCKI